MGDSFMELEKIPEAINSYSRAIDIEPDNFEAYCSRAFAKAEVGQKNDAIQDFSTAITLAPDDEKTALYYHRAGLHGIYEEYNEAIQDYSKAVELSPHLGEIYCAMGLAKLMIGLKESGCLDLSRAGELGDGRAYELIRKYCNK